MKTLPGVFVALLVILQVYSVASNWAAFEKAVVKNSRWNKHVEKRAWGLDKWLPGLIEKLGGEKEKEKTTEPKPDTFSCPPSTSLSTPTSVHKLLPGDIKVVGAIGDSLTAANGAGAETPIGVLFQYRGVAWSIGGRGALEGSEATVTLPNILKKFNSKLVGFSTGIGGTSSKGAALNRAEPGAVAGDMLAQAKSLVSTMRKTRGIDRNRDWKMVTLFVGGNDLCDSCNDMVKHSPDAYVSNIKAALDYLQKNLRRTVVNLVQMFDISDLAELSSGPLCSLLHQALCECALGGPENKAKVQKLVRQYNEGLERLVATGAYDSRDDFTVVLQPFLRDTTLPKVMKAGKEVYDTTFFAPDCFHFAEKGHQAMAVGLWNGLFQAVGSKSTKWSFVETLKCPATGAYLATAKNSKA